MQHRTRSAVIAFFAIAAGTGADLYKWVDENGITHYTDEPPSGRPSKEIRPLPKPTAPATAAPAKSPHELEREFQKRRVEREMSTATKPPSVMPTEETSLVSSQYLITTKTWVNYEMRSAVLSGTIGLAVKAKRENQRDVWTEVRFEVPPGDASDIRLLDNPDPYLVTVVLPNRIRIAPNQEVRIEAPPAGDLRCRSYRVEIIIYADDAGREALGDHLQFVYSRVNGMKVRTDAVLREALRATGKCVPP